MAARDYYNRDAGKELVDRLAAGPLVMQGPMGSLLIDEAGAADVPSAFWNIAEPQTLTRMHALYQMAGADILVTNTFQASAPCLERDGISQGCRAVNRAGVDCALACSRITGVPARLVLGSMGPCGVEWEAEESPEREIAFGSYRDQASILLESGVSGILLETFCSKRDFSLAMAASAEVADGMPVLASFSIDEAGNLVGDGSSIEEAAALAQRLGAVAIGVNCCSIAAATGAVPRMARAAGLHIMVRPNAGIPSVDKNGLPHWDEDGEEIARACVQWVRDGAGLVGTCCGFTPVATCVISGMLQD